MKEFSDSMTTYGQAISPGVRPLPAVTCMSIPADGIQETVPMATLARFAAAKRMAISRAYLLNSCFFKYRTGLADDAAPQKVVI